MSAPGGFRRNLAVVIGVDAYAGGIPPLRSAVNDARRLGEILAGSHDFSVLSLFDAEASLPGLDDLLAHRLPREVGPDDRVVFYFAGHGLAVDGDDGPDGFLLPHDARRGEPDTYVAMTRLHDALHALPCRHMLVVLDSCFSGAFRWSSMRAVMTAATVVHRERYDRFVYDPAWQVLTSAAYDQTAADALLSGSLGSRGDTGAHSPFALALFEALAGAADVAPAGGDGVITATELYLYLEGRLQVETLARKRRQTPGLWPLRKHDKGEFVFLVPGRELNLPPAPPLTHANNPYRGLASYDREDAGIFFGREALIDDLADSVTARPLTVVLGASGTGKSSVVKAGVVPRLERDGGWTALPVVRPGASPFQAMARALSTSNAEVEATTEGILEAMRRRLGGGDSRVLLVIDQFEELVTLTRAIEMRDAFLDLMADLTALDRKRLRIIVTLRTDFEAHFDRTRLRDLWHAGRAIVPPMSRQEFRAVIEAPASQRVLYFEPTSLVETLIDDVSAMPGGLPLLSFTLSEMYRRYVERGSDNRALTQDDYDALGGVGGALRSRADAEVAALDPAHQATLRRLMLRMLVVEQGTLARQRVARDQLIHWNPAESDRIATVLGRLSEARLVVEGVAADGAAYVEPAHDALVTSWGHLLGWTHAAQEREPDLNFLHALARTAQDWDRAHASARTGLLWRDKVRSSRLWALSTSDRIQMNRVEDGFCRASVARRRFVRNGLAALVAAIAASGILATALGIVAQRQRAEAVLQRDAAERQTRAAWSSSLTTKAATAIDSEGNPTKGFKLAAAALEADGSNSAAAMLLRKALYGAGLFEYRGRWHGAPLYREVGAGASWIAWSPDGGHLAAGRFIDDGNGVQEVEVLAADGTRRSRFDAGGGLGFEGGRFSTDGVHILEPGEPPVTAWDLDGRPVSPSHAASLRPGPAPAHESVAEVDRFVYRSAVTPDGRVTAGHGVDRWTPGRLFDAASLGPFLVMKDGRTLNVVPGEWMEAAVTWDGRYLATGSLDGTVALWRIDDGASEAARLADLWRGSDRIEALEFSPDGSRLAASELGGGLYVWDLTRDPLDPGPGATVGRQLPTASADGRLIATLTSRGDYEATLRVEDRAAGTTWARSFGSVDTHVALLGDGLVVASDSRRLWLIDPRGVEQVAVPVVATVVGVTEDQHGVLIESAGDAGWAGTLVLPVVAGDLTLRAPAPGHLAPTPAERARWDIEGILTGLAAMSRPQGASGLLPSWIPGSIRGLFTGVGGNTDANVPSPEAASGVDLPRAPATRPTLRAVLTTLLWAGLAAPPCTEPQAGLGFGSRVLYCAIYRSGALHTIAANAGLPVFLSGPHRGVELDLAAPTFGHYNPAFVRWVYETLLPAPEATALVASTAPTYDRLARKAGRAYYFGLQQVEANPGAVGRLTAALRDGVEPAAALERAEAELAESSQPAESVDARFHGDDEMAWHFLTARRFWLRRSADGTRREFEAGLHRLLEVYDPAFLAAPQR